jgi:AcrR family transcriptional regulator
MDKRKIANQQVKNKLLSVLLTLMPKKEWSKITITELINTSGVARASFYRNFKSVEELMNYGLEQFTERYHQNSPSPVEDFHNRELMVYKFQFYKENADMILAFHNAKAPLTLLGVITDCVIYSCGDMSVNSISKYELYYYSGAFYNMVLSWLENGSKELPEAMADEFLRITNRKERNTL